MQSLKQFWGSFRLLPSAWLLLVQLALLVMAMLTYGDSEYRALTWSLGVLALLIIAKVIRQTPVFTFWGLVFVSGAFLFSILIFIFTVPPFNPVFCPRPANVPNGSFSVALLLITSWNMISLLKPPS